MGRYDRPIFGEGHRPTPTAPGKRSRPSAPPSTPRPRRRRRLSLQGQFMLFSALVLVVIGGIAYAYLRPKDDTYVVDSYQYATVATRDFRDLIITNGTVEPEEVTVFAAPVGARVAEVHVQPGDDVERDEVLLVLVSEQLLEDVDKARTDVDEAEFDLEQARLQAEADLHVKEQTLATARRDLTGAEEQLPLMEQLLALGGVSASEFEDAVAEVERLQRQVANATQDVALSERQGELARRQAEQKARGARRQLEKLEEQLADMTVRADVAGRVLSMSVRPGQHVASGAELLRHADVTKQHVETAVSPEQAARLQPGNAAVLRVGGRQIPATVTFVAPQAQTAGERTAVPVTLAIDADVSASLRPFTETTVELELGVRTDRPALTRGPYFSSGDASFVYVISDDGTQARRHDVRYGAVDGNAVEIVEGLQPGDRIVFSSYTAYRTNAEIELIPEGGRPVE